MRISLLLLALALLALPVAAQTQYTVSPAQYATVEGGSPGLYPFMSHYATYSYQQVFDDMKGTPRPIKAFTTRRYYTGNKYTAWSWTATIKLSTAKTTAANLSNTFANNEGTDVVTVANNVTFNFPPSTNQSGVHPQPWEFNFPFTTVFPFTAQGSLLVEMRVFSHTIQKSFDVVYMDKVAARYQTQNFGTGYKVPAHTQTSRCYSSGSLSSGQHRIYAYGYYLPIGTGAAIWMAGLSNTTFMGLTLPFNVGPLGFTGQNLYIAPMLFIGPVTTGTSSTGYTSFSSSSIYLPQEPWFVGVKLYNQIICIDSGAPNGLFFTSGSSVEIPSICTSVSYCYKTNDNGTSPTGSVHSNQGTIYRFTH